MSELIPSESASGIKTEASSFKICGFVSLGKVRNKIKIITIREQKILRIIIEEKIERAELRFKKCITWKEYLEELKELLGSMTYQAIQEQQAIETENLQRTLAGVPLPIFVG